MENAIETSETLKQLADAANEAHRECQRSVQTTLEQAQRCGEILTRAKRLVEHGEWGKWLATNFEGSDRTARVYMQIASNPQEFAQNRQTSAVLSIEAAVKLLAKPKPEPAALPAPEPEQPKGIRPERIFHWHTEFESDEQKEAVEAQLRPWVPFGYFPIFERHPITGRWFLHTMLEPNETSAKKWIALLFAAWENGLPYNDLDDLCIALAKLRDDMGPEKWAAHVAEQWHPDVDWVNTIIDTVNARVARFPMVKAA